MLNRFSSTTHMAEWPFAIQNRQVFMKSCISLRHCPFLTLHSVCGKQTNEHGALAKLYWEGKAEAFGENPVPMPLCPPHISGNTINYCRLMTSGHLKGILNTRAYEEFLSLQPSTRAGIVQTGSSVSIVTTLRAGWPETRVLIPCGAEILSFSLNPYWLWGSLSFLSNGYWELWAPKVVVVARRLSPTWNLWGKN
jgi:hypothetical protein